MSSRDLILARVREAKPAPALEYEDILRTYRHRGERTLEERLELLSDRLTDYGCGVQISSREQIPHVVKDRLRESGRNVLVATPDVPREWLPEAYPDGDTLSDRELDGVDGVITLCALAIAETGTIVLRHDGASGRRALTLIPDYHLCILFEEQIVELVPEAIRRMATFVPAPITTISGPSATSDIEMTRVKGVHGPRTLDVLIVK